MQLTEKEMIDLWLLSKGYEPLRTDATIIRTDGVDIRAIARLECRRWYHRLLLEGDPSLLIPEEMAGDPTVTRHATERGSLIVTMPTAVVRPLSACLEGWDADAPVIPADTPLARRQSAPYAAAGPAAPLAVLRRDGRLELFSMAAGSDSLLSLRCVTLRTDSDGAPIYSFADCALSTI